MLNLHKFKRIVINSDKSVKMQNKDLELELTRDASVYHFDLFDLFAHVCDHVFDNVVL